MCTEQSYPTSTAIGASKPIIDDSPVVGQPPRLVNVSRASEALARGAMTQSGMIMAKKPRICRIKTIPSEQSQLRRVP